MRANHAPVSLMRKIALLVLLSTPSVAAAQSLPASRPAAPAKLALLIGVGRHAPNTPADVGPLAGPRNDVQLVAEVLRERFGFAHEEIKTVLDHEATHEGVVRAFDHHLIARAGAHTQVFVFYTGHGSRVPDVARDPALRERSGFDSTLVLHDSRAVDPRGGYDLTDDELHSLVAAIPSEWVTVVTDACFSGGSLRGPDERALRTVPRGATALAWERVRGFWPAGVPFLEDDDPRRRRPDATFWLQIAACAEEEEAREWTLAATPEGYAGRTFGLLTWCLLEAMRRAQPGDTYLEVAGEARLAVSGRSTQTVRVEGNQDRRFLDARFERRPDGFPARLLESGALRVSAGTLHAVGKGVVLSVRDAEGKEQGKASVSACGPLESRADWQGGAAPGDRSKVLFAVPLTRAETVEPLRVSVADEAVRALLGTSAWFTIVAGADARTGAFDYRLVVSGDAEERRARLHTAEGQPILEEARVTLADIEYLAHRETRFQRLWRLGSPGLTGTLCTTAAFADATEHDLSTKHKDERVKNARARLAPLPGVAGLVLAVTVDDYGEQDKALIRRLTRITLRNQLDTDCHVCVLSLNETRNIEPILPGERSSEPVKLNRGKEDRALVWIGSEDAWVLPRPMRERYLVIAADREIPLDGLLRGTMRGDEPRVAALPEVLREALTVSVLRGPAPSRIEDARWGVTVLDVVITRAAPESGAPRSQSVGARPDSRPASEVETPSKPLGRE